jgi:hypothetical protein
MFLHRNETAIFPNEMSVLAVQPPVIVDTLETETAVMRVKDLGDAA